MSTDMMWQTESTSSEATEQLAEQLGRRLRGGEVIELISDLGGGKTTFVRGLAKGMGSTDRVTSPTFTLNKVYTGFRQPESLRLDAGQGVDEKRTEPYMKYGEGVSESITQPSAKRTAGVDGSASQQSSSAQVLWLHHYDFYRLGDAGLMAHELEDIINDPKVVLVVEWADVVKHVLPEKKLTITITRSGEDARQLEFAYPESLTYLLENL